MMAGDVGFSESADNWADEVSERFEDYDGPMMNYRYPVFLREIDEREAAKALDGLPLCLIEDMDEGDY